MRERKVMIDKFYVHDFLADGDADSDAVEKCLSEAEKCESRIIVFFGQF